MQKFQNKQFVEIIGIGCLVLSLAFVGYEIRQNTNAAKSEAFQQFHLAASAFDLDTTTNELLLSVFEKLDSGTPFEELGYRERLTLRMYYSSVVSLWAGLYYSVNAGVLPENTLSATGGAGVFAHSAFAKLWPTFRLRYDEDYALFIDSRISALQNLDREG